MGNAGRKSFETTDGRQVSYQWDEAGNRARTTWSDAYFVAYSYDDLNRMQYARENSTTAYTPNTLNQYSAVAGQAATYDLNGDLLTWFPLDGSGKHTYTYDNESRDYR